MDGSAIIAHLKHEADVKTENCESVDISESEVHQVVESQEHVEETEVATTTVVLQNIEIQQEHNFPVILQDFRSNSVGNLQINDLSSLEENIIHTYIIEGEYEGVEGHEIIYERVADDEDENTLHYVIQEGNEYQEDSEINLEVSDHVNRYTIHNVEEEIVDDPEPDVEEDLTIEEDSNSEQNGKRESSQVGVQEENEQIIKLPCIKKEEELIECDLCQKYFRTAAALKRHITVNHQAKNELDVDDPLTLKLCLCCGEPSDSAHTVGDFKCDQCGKLFLQSNYLQRHICIEHPINDQYNCSDCKRVFKVKEDFLDHMKIHPFKTVKCLDCNREFSRKYHLDRHIGQTGCMGYPRKAYECRVCNKFFTRKDNLAEHLRIHAGQGKKKKKYTCEYCNKEFHGHSLLNIHIRTHTGEKPYPCDLCPKSFPSSGAMKKHRRMHTGEKPYRCDKCDKNFAAKETLNRHCRIHTGEKPHTCQFCGKSFIQPSQLRAHIFHHTGENAYTCHYCGRAFNRRLRLTTHIKFMHEGADPLPCEQCDKSFFRKEDLARHMLSHSDEKSFVCDICQKGFSVKSSLKIHKLTHKKEQPCSCETCGRAFIRKDCLMRHIRARHRDVLEDILANAEKKRLQQQLLSAATSAASVNSLTENDLWNELTLTESIKELLNLLVDEECLLEFGYPDAPVDRVLDCVIRRCGYKPASDEDFDYIGRMRENAKLLFTVVIDDEAVKELLNNQTVDEVILHVLRLAKKDHV